MPRDLRSAGSLQIRPITIGVMLTSRHQADTVKQCPRSTCAISAASVPIVFRLPHHDRMYSSTEGYSPSLSFRHFALLCCMPVLALQARQGLMKMMMKKKKKVTKNEHGKLVSAGRSVLYITQVRRTTKKLRASSSLNFPIQGELQKLRPTDRCENILRMPALG